MNRIDHALHRLILAPSRAPGGRTPRERPESALPADRRPRNAGRTILVYAVASVLPPVVAALLVPLRVEHAAAAALVMVLPVLLVAAIGASGPAVVAAVSAALAFDLLLTEPYLKLVISDPDDIAAALTLGAVGLIVGVLSSRLAHLAARDGARNDELRHLVRFIDESATETSADELSSQACEHLVGLLGLQRCEWMPRVRESSGPVLLPSGSLMGRLSELKADRSKLPENLHVPVFVEGRQQGCFLLTPDTHRLTSVEERRTAATIVTLFSTTVAADA